MQPMESIEQVEIVLVEDNPLDAELTIKALTEAGLANRLLWLKDGEQALDYLFRRGAHADRDDSLPRLLLLDLKMPRISGLEVLQAIKAEDRTRRIPVVVMTSSREETDLARSYDIGVNGYIVKPLDFSALSEVVKQAGYYWLAVNHAPPH
jgi:CheY-like chemotaxis protein